MRTEDDWSARLTRRDVLAQAARGLALATVAQILDTSTADGQVAVAPSKAAPRSRESFDLGWKFFLGEATGAQSPGFADAGWRDVDLPHDWSIEGSFDEKAASSGSGGYLPTGIGWYRKSFSVAEADREKAILLEFDGVYQNSEVWINEKYLGLRPYGFVPFSYELTPYLNFGGKNVIAVRVDNSRQTNCRWYTGSGIYRHTWLLTTDRLRVAYWGTFVNTARVSSQYRAPSVSPLIEVKTRIANGRASSALCKLTTGILNADGRLLQTQEGSQTIESGGEYEFAHHLPFDNPSLWSPSNPYLYTVRSTVREAGKVVDVYDTPFGIRTAVFDATRGFLLNGRPLKLNGVCLHHDGGSVGAAVPERVWERRLELLQEMGCNAIRTSHNPYAAEFLDLCDRMGFLVMNEAFDEWKKAKGNAEFSYHIYFDEWHERDMVNFIHRDRNHPSVVLWSAGNEVPDQFDPHGAETLRGLNQIFHREDPTRLVTVGCDHVYSEPASENAKPEFLAELDVVGYNYVDRWRDRANKYYSIDHDAFPRRRVIGTESPGINGIRGDYRAIFPEYFAANGAKVVNRPGELDIEQLWKFVRTYDYVSGDFMWTGIDHLGEARWPMKGSTTGVLDTCGFKKDGFYFYQSQWTSAPMLHLFPHWNWPGKEGEVISVTCYTNCDTVELFHNGKSMGVKGYQFPRLGMEDRYGNMPERSKVLRTTSDLHLSWDVLYAPGTLKAVGTKHGAIVSIVEVVTTGEPARLVMKADRSELLADGRDVAHMTVEIQDDQGRVVPTAGNEITFQIEGEGRIIGVDNGDPGNHEDFKANHHLAFNGLCLAIVQTTRKGGEIQLSASSPSLQGDSVTLMTKI